MKLQGILKALYASAAAAIASAQAAYISSGHIGWAAGFVIAGSALGAFGVVWGVPNKTEA